MNILGINKALNSSKFPILNPNNLKMDKPSIDKLDLVVDHILKKCNEKRDELSQLDKKFYGKNAYERLFCNIFEMRFIFSNDKDQRYADAFLDFPDQSFIKVELKKTKSGSYWINMVRIAEIILALRGELEDPELSKRAIEESITLFIQTGEKTEKKQKIPKLRRFYLVKTSELVRFINMSEDEIKQCIKLKEKRGNVHQQLSLKMTNLLEYTTGIELVFGDKIVNPIRTKGSGVQDKIPKPPPKRNHTDLRSLVKDLISEIKKGETFTSKDLYQKAKDQDEWEQKDFTSYLSKLSKEEKSPIEKAKDKKATYKKK